MLTTIIRLVSGVQGAFGKIRVVNPRDFHHSLFEAVSLEKPWLYNLPCKSCIPAGIYTVYMEWSYSWKKRLYTVQDVKNRTYIRMHPANFAGDEEKGNFSELLGCITLGARMNFFAPRGHTLKQWGVINSNFTLNRFVDALKGKPFSLQIIDDFQKEDKDYATVQKIIDVHWNHPR